MFDTFVNIFECILITLFLYFSISDRKQHAIVYSIIYTICDFVFIQIINQYSVTAGLLFIAEVAYTFVFVDLISYKGKAFNLMLSIIPFVVFAISNIPILLTISRLLFKDIYNRNIMLYMLKLMRITGIRSQEVRALRRENIIISETESVNGNGNILKSRIAYVCIRRSIGSNKNEHVAEVSTKTPQSARDIPLSGSNIDLLKEILEYSKHDLIFANYDGKPFSSEDLSDYLYRVSKSCGIKVYSLLMRKSFSADLYREGVNPAITKRLMGHKKEDMSLNAYASAGKEELINTTANRKYKKQQLHIFHGFFHG